jgi:hypothetical protein
VSVEKLDSGQRKKRKKYTRRDEEKRGQKGRGEEERKERDGDKRGREARNGLKLTEKFIEKSVFRRVRLWTAQKRNIL